jgi:hypothetical protein
MNGLEILIGGLIATILVLTIGLAKLAQQNKKLHKEQK